METLRINFCPFCGAPIDHFSEAGEVYKCFSCSEEFVVLETAEFENAEKQLTELMSYGRTEEERGELVNLGLWLENRTDDLSAVLAFVVHELPDLLKREDLPTDDIRLADELLYELRKKG